METPAHDALLHRNRQMQIQYWQERTSHEIEQQEQGVNSRLFQNCQDALQCLIRHLDADLVSTREHNTLRRCLASLQLWSDGHGVTTGVLDNILDRSKSLQLTTLSILNPMCEALSQGLRTHVLPTNYDTTAVMICNSAGELCSQTRWLLVDHEDDASDSDNESINSDDDAKNDIHDLIQRVRTYTDSLIDLGTALDCPALEPELQDRPILATLEQRSAQDYHRDLIEIKFPQAESHLLQILGQTSWSRYQRMQQEREASMHAQTSCSISHVAGSHFQDSGIGTSLPRDKSAYAETIISYMTSLSEGKRVNIPSLPAEAKVGLPFECTACARHVQITNNRDWRKHLYMDLRPYNCLFVSCSFTHEPFANRQLWADHLELGHGYGPAWEAVHCPLCLETTNSGKNAILVHFARHLEEIALTSLPRDVESDVESEVTTGTNVSSNFTHEMLLNNNPEGETSTLRKLKQECLSWQVRILTYKSPTWIETGSGRCRGRTDGIPYVVVEAAIGSILLQISVSETQQWKKYEKDNTIVFNDGTQDIALKFEDATGCNSIADYLLERGARRVTHLPIALASTTQKEELHVSPLSVHNQAALKSRESLHSASSSLLDGIPGSSGDPTTAADGMHAFLTKVLTERTPTLTSHLVSALAEQLNNPASMTDEDRAMLVDKTVEHVKQKRERGIAQIHEEAKKLLSETPSLRSPAQAAPRMLDAQSDPEDTNWTANTRTDSGPVETGEEAKASRSTNNDIYNIECICGTSEDDGNTVLCEGCDTWQHIRCFYSSAEHVPDVHKCANCSPETRLGEGTYRKSLHGTEDTQAIQRVRERRQISSLAEDSLVGIPSDREDADLCSTAIPRSSGTTVTVPFDRDHVSAMEVLDPKVETKRTGRKALKIHECECGRSYTRAEHLRRHQRNHAQEDPMSCKYPNCRKLFYRLDLLQRHEERHGILDGRSQTSVNEYIESPLFTADLTPTHELDNPIPVQPDDLPRFLLPPHTPAYQVPAPWEQLASTEPSSAAPISSTLHIPITSVSPNPGPGPHLQVPRDANLTDFTMHLGAPVPTAQRTDLPNEPYHSFAPVPLDAIPVGWLRENADAAQMLKSWPHSPPAFATNASGEKPQPTEKCGKDSQPNLDCETEHEEWYKDGKWYIDGEPTFYQSSVEERNGDTIASSSFKQVYGLHDQRGSAKE